MRYLQLALIGFSMLFSIYSFGQAPEGEPVMKDTTMPKPEIGFKIGANFQTISGADWVQTYNTGVVGGFFLGFHKKKVGVNVEILASTTSYKSTYGLDSEQHIGDFNITYLNIPILLEYNVIHALSIQVGPEYDNMLSAGKKSAFDGDPKVLFKSGQFSAVIGLEAKLPAHIIAGARYVYGLSDINNSALPSTATWQNSAMQVYIGYRIK